MARNHQQGVTINNTIKSIKKNNMETNYFILTLETLNLLKTSLGPHKVGHLA